MYEEIFSIISLNMILAIIVGFLSGVIRGYAGFASGLLLVPLFTLLFRPIEGIAIAAIAPSAGDLQLMPYALRSVYWRKLIPTLGFAACAVSIGVMFLVSNEPEVIKDIMGYLLLLASLILITGWAYSGVRNLYTSIGAGTISGGALGAFGLPAGQFFALYRTVE